MTQEERSLLTRDVFSRLFYGVFVQDIEYNLPPAHIGQINIYREEVRLFADIPFRPIDCIRPYLRPLSSMTEKERAELKKICGNDLSEFAEFITKGHGLSRDGLYMFDKLRQLDWLNKNHFDYRGLIPKGLALEAKEGMYAKE